MRQVLYDVCVGIGLALTIALIVLCSTFHSTFLYTGF